MTKRIFEGCAGSRFVLADTQRRTTTSSGERIRQMATLSLQDTYTFRFHRNRQQWTSFRSLHTHNDSHLWFLVRNSYFERTTGLVFVTCLAAIVLKSHHFTNKGGKNPFRGENSGCSCDRAATAAVLRKVFWLHFCFFSPQLLRKLPFWTGTKIKEKNRKSVCPQWADYGSHDFPDTSKVFVCGRLAQWMEALMYVFVHYSESMQ